jgi:hypothetical protein
VAYPTKGQRRHWPDAWNHVHLISVQALDTIREEIDSLTIDDG